MSSSKKVLSNQGLGKRMDVYATEKFPEMEKKSRLIVPSTTMVGIDHPVSVIATGDDFGEIDKQIKKYNAGIEELDPLYASLVPVRGIIVRMQQIDMNISEGGIISRPRVQILIGTRNGFVKDKVEAKYQFKRFGVIAAVSPSFAQIFSPGMLVQVFPDVILPVKETDLSDERLPFGFTHHTYPEMTPPTHCNDRHFGYFLLKDPMSQVECIVKPHEYPLSDEETFEAVS